MNCDRHALLPRAGIPSVRTTACAAPRLALGAVAGLAAVLLAGCGAPRSQACAGMVYAESGLSRQQFRSCAAAMVQQLDRAHGALTTMADKNQPIAARTGARAKCLAATGDLASLLREAGGSTKLLAAWSDRRLNKFNWDVIAARDYYTMVCYYGPKVFDQTGTPFTSVRDSDHEEARQILAEIQ